MPLHSARFALALLFVCVGPASGRAQGVADTRVPLHPALSPDGRSLAYLLGDSVLVVATEGAGRTPRLIARGTADEASTPMRFLRWSPDGETLLFRAASSSGDATLYVAPANGNRAARPLLPDSLSTRLSTFQNAWAGGPAWSPDGRRIAFLAAHEGESSAGLQVYVTDVRSGATRRWTDTTQARFGVAWSPDGRWLAVTSGSFARDAAAPRGRIAVLDARPGAAGAPLLSVEDSTPLLLAPSWSPDGRILLAQDGANRTLALRATPGAAAHAARATVLAHTLPLRRWVAWLPDGSGLLAHTTQAMSTRVVRVSFPSGASTLISSPDTTVRVVDVVRRADGRNGGVWAALAVQAGSVPPDVWLAPLGGVAVGPMQNVTRTGDRFVTTERPRSEIVRYASGAGDTLHAQLLLPPVARAAGAPPLVIVPYGSYRNDFLGGNYFLNEGLRALLARGWAIARPNTRGQASDERDQGRYGELQLEDTHLLLDALGRAARVDTSRVALIGHSHGGAMVYYYLTHSARFCAGVAINGRADWVLQANHPNGGDGLLPAILGATPAESPALYARLSPAANARQLTAPLLGVAGGKDTQILPRNVPIMADSAHAAGKIMEALEFPDEGHLIERGANRARLWERTLATLDAGCARATR